jgi:hypothetical protein
MALSMLAVSSPRVGLSSTRALSSKTTMAPVSVGRGRSANSSSERLTSSSRLVFAVEPETSMRKVRVAGLALGLGRPVALHPQAQQVAAVLVVKGWRRGRRAVFRRGVVGRVRRGWAGRGRCGCRGAGRKAYGGDRGDKDKRFVKVASRQAEQLFCTLE